MRVELKVVDRWMEEYVDETVSAGGGKAGWIAGVGL